MLDAMPELSITDLINRSWNEDSFETDLLGSVPKKYMSKCVIACKVPQRRTSAQSAGEIWRQHILELSSSQARDLEYLLYPCPCHSLAKCCSWGHKFPGTCGSPSMKREWFQEPEVIESESTWGAGRHENVTGILRDMGEQ